MTTRKFLLLALLIAQLAMHSVASPITSEALVSSEQSETVEPALEAVSDTTDHQLDKRGLGSRQRFQALRYYDGKKGGHNRGW
ncbi:hypothetical protein BKA69DRAFT_1100948 [Paraphysoderma sedebokerense]|nr:hypothetical protein BKA69DRAFT_1100948 [Paraphysoderma sedebokerense]